MGPKKAAANVRKHRVSLEEAATAFADSLSLTIPDPDHSRDEARYLILGLSERQRLLLVGHTEHDDTIRLITARLATRHERRAYEEGL